MKNKITSFDQQQAASFLEVLTGTHNPAVTFQTFDDNKTRKDSYLSGHVHGVFHGDIYNHLKHRQKGGAGVFVMVNEGNGRGRKAQKRCQSTRPVSGYGRRTNGARER